MSRFGSSLVRGLRPVLLLLLVGTGFARAEWTGVYFELGSLDSDWEFSDEVREAKSDLLAIRIEERLESGLAVGGGLAYHSLRLDGQGNSESIKFEAENLIIYLRQDFSLGETVTLEGTFQYDLYSGRENTSDDRASLDWSQVTLELAAAFRFEKWRVTPFVSYATIDGDTSGVEGGGSFELEDPYNQGIRFDIFTDPTSYVGIELQTGSQTAGYLSFVRRYE